MTRKLSEYRLILFDMDGTLYYQPPLQLHMGCLMLLHCLRPGGLAEMRLILAFRKLREQAAETNAAGAHSLNAASEEAAPPQSRVTGTRHTESPDEALYRSLADRYQISPDEVKRVVAKWIYDRPLAILPRYRDRSLASLLWQLYEKGCQVAIYSDYPASDKAAVLSLPPVPCYDGGQPRIACLKPDPKGIQAIMADNKVTDPSSVLMIGDRQSKDGMAAAAAGADYLILPKINPLSRKKLLKGLL